MSVTAFPLQWPAGWPRSRSRTAAKFNQKVNNGRYNETKDVTIAVARARRPHGHHPRTQKGRRMSDRAHLICERISKRLDVITRAVPPIKPEAAHWLNSDGGPSYCWECAIIARGREFELGPLIKINPWWHRRDEWEDSYFDGIDGGFDTQSDSTVACEICGNTLSYILTDDGVESEIEYYGEAPLITVRDEDSYALDRLALNIWSGAKRRLILGVAVAVNQAFRLVQKQPGVDA